jgi:transglutaminase-like putative cysteine protease
MVARKLLYLVGFVGLALTAALAVDRVGSPSIARLLAFAVLVASAAGSPGLVRHRFWPLALALIPLGALLLLRGQLSFPPTVHGFWDQLGFYREQLGAGGRAYVTQRLPFDFAGTPGLRLLFSMMIYAVVALAAFLALSLRKALLSIVVLLVPLGFGLTVDQVDRAVWPPLAFLLLAGCLLMLSRSLGRQRWRPSDYLPGVATMLLASLLGLWMLAATSAAASQPWQDWRTWGGSLSGRVDSSVFFNWMEDYPSLLNPADNAQIMRVRSPVASYWRANALDYFNGTAWRGANPYEVEVKPEARTPANGSGSYSYNLPVSPQTVPGRVVTEGFAVTSLFTDYLFSGGTPRKLIADRELPLYLNDEQGLSLRSPVGPRLDYEVTAVVPQLKPGDLVGRGRVYPPDVLADTDLPFPGLANVGLNASESTWRQAMKQTGVDRRWMGLYRLDRTIVAGATDPYEIGLRIEAYLRGHFTYSLRTPQAATQSPYAAFLFTTRRGYCQQFAGGMAVLMRFNGIPARVAVGFTSGREVKHGVFVVSRTDAHAWVEAYFPKVGWVPFDPTPGRSLPGAGASSTSTGFVSPFAGQNGGAGGAVANTGRQRLRDLARNSRIGGAGGGGGFSSRASSARLLLFWGVVIVLVLFAWPVVRALLRRRAERRGSLDRRLRASLELMLEELDDYGLVVPRSQTLEETSSLIRRDVGLDATSLVARVQAVLFGARSATEKDLDDVAALRRQLRRSLRARAGWARAVLALYGLRPASAGRA